jgi:hypothetical protein
VARTLVLTLHSALPPGTSVRLASVGRRVLAAAYLRAYGRTIDRQWQRVCAIARLAEDVDGEREGILKALQRRSRRDGGRDRRA